jgi:hypothetical protein
MPSKTVLIYLQIDGQPVEPSQWQQENPWKPTLKEKDSDPESGTLLLMNGYTKVLILTGGFFPASTSDAKGPAMAFLAASGCAAIFKDST